MENKPTVKRGEASLEPPDRVWLGTRVRCEQLDTPSGSPITLTVDYRSTAFDARVEKADLTFSEKTIEIPAESIEAKNPLRLSTYFPKAFERTQGEPK